MAKQKLSAKAAAAKKARDLAYAKTPKRRKRKRENQARGQRSDSDLHHTKSGDIVRVSVAYNRTPPFLSTSVALSISSIIFNSFVKSYILLVFS